MLSFPFLFNISTVASAAKEVEVKKIIENKVHKTRKTWHQDCATDYMIIYHSGEARKHIWKRDKGRCNDCGKQCTRRGWDLDHVRPLLEQKGLKEDELDWTYYGLDNMQTLCRPCHREKTNQDKIYSVTLYLVKLSLYSY